MLGSLPREQNAACDYIFRDCIFHGLLNPPRPTQRIRPVLRVPDKSPALQQLAGEGATNHPCKSVNSTLSSRLSSSLCCVWGCCHVWVQNTGASCSTWAAGQAWQQAQQAAQVAVRLDSAQAAAGQQRDPDRDELGSLVAAAEQPVAAPSTWRRSASTLLLLCIGSCPLVTSAAGLALDYARSAACPHRRALQDLRSLLLAGQERVHLRTRLGLSDLQPFCGRTAGNLPCQKDTGQWSA